MNCIMCKRNNKKNCTFTMAIMQKSICKRSSYT